MDGQNHGPSEPVFAALAELITPYADLLVCTEQSDKSLSYNTRHVMKNKKSLFFSAVKTNKNYVSFHLMPVYVFPELLAPLSSELKRRMPGKSCFNFRAVEELKLDELRELVTASVARFKQAGYLEE